MGAHVLLNSLNELRKSDKMRGLPSILLLFLHDFNKFNNTGARILNSIHHMTLRLLENRIFWRGNVNICHILRNVIMNVITLRYLICKQLVVNIQLLTDVEVDMECY